MREVREVGFSYSAEEYKCTELAGVRMIDYYNDVKLMVDARQKAAALISEALDIPPPEPALDRGHVRCPEYMGCQMFYPDDDEPFVQAPVLASISDVKGLRLPDPPDHPIACKTLEKAREFFELTGTKSSIGIFEGPFTTAAFMRGQTAFMTDWTESPSLCEELMRITNDTIIAWKKWHDAEMGIGPEDATALVDDSITLISPGDFEKLVLPQLLRWFDAFPSGQRIFHCCGDITRHMPALAKMDLSQYALMGEMVDAMEAKKAFKNCYISQLYDFRVLRDCGEEDVLLYTNDLMERSYRGGNYGIVVEGIRGVPLAKARIVRDAVAEFNGGNLPGIPTQL